MIRRLMINDLRANKLVTLSACIFMAVTAMLLGLAIFLFASLASSIDTLMIKAQTPHFLQMHAGEPEIPRIDSFAAQREDVEEKQICGFLNLQNSLISIGDRSFINNMQDNGLCRQGESFDYLLDEYNRLIRAEKGEVYVPVAYKKEYGIRRGELMKIGTEQLTVAGFLRDSQMNSMMASSKRFLVSDTDYERLKELGSEEYLIEFRLKEGSDVNEFATAYKDAGLPENGPAITYPLIRMINVLSDGIMILVILLVSLVVLFISILCIRYILLTQLEKDRHETGMLRAVGIRGKEVSQYYMLKYLILSLIGCIVGSVLAAVTAGMLGSGIKETYGEAENKFRVYIFMILGAVLAELIIFFSIRRTLCRAEKEAVVSLLRGKGDERKKNKLWRPALIIPAAAVFMILVPLGMKSTMADPEFVSYMGIGNSHIRIDVRQNGDSYDAALQIAREIQNDGRVERFSLMRTGAYKMRLSDGRSYNMLLENGDHGIFPLKYGEGRYPENEKEIALSVLSAEEMGVSVGDAVSVSAEGEDGKTEEHECTVCGIYSDITNGGKTAKGCFDDSRDKTPTMWSIVYLSLKDESTAGEWVEEQQKRFASADEGIRLIEISGYLQGIYGQTIRNISGASVLTIALSLLIIMVVIVLLMRLIIWKERRDSSLKKALGISSAMIRRDYLKKLALFVLAGVLLGVLAGNVLGQKLAGGLLGLMGAPGFQFVIDPLEHFILVPTLILVSAASAAALSLAEVGRIHATECLDAEAD